MTELQTLLSEPDDLVNRTCSHCHAAMAADQRWCLTCGQRRPEIPTPFTGAAAPEPPPRPPLAPPVAVTPRDGRVPNWLMGTIVTGAAAVLFALGLIVGLSGRKDRTYVSVPVAAAKAPDVNVTVTGGGGSGVSAASTPTPFASDWPDGKDGWTVQLQALSNASGDTSALDAAKTAAEGSGAKDVGALNSDDYASLDAGKYIVYSGVYKTKAAATAALGKLKKNFKKAKVIQVSATGDTGPPPETVSKAQLEQNQHLTPEQYQEQSKKAPDKVGTEGTPPPTDNAPAGGGSEGTTIG